MTKPRNFPDRKHERRLVAEARGAHSGATAERDAAALRANLALASKRYTKKVWPNITQARAERQGKILRAV